MTDILNWTTLLGIVESIYDVVGPVLPWMAGLAIAGLIGDVLLSRIGSKRGGENQ